MAVKNRAGRLAAGRRKAPLPGYAASLVDPTPAALAALFLLLLRAAAAAAEASLAASSTVLLKEAKVSVQVLEAFASLKARPEATFAALRALLVTSLTLAATFGAAAGAIWFAPIVPRLAPFSPELATAAGPLLGGLCAALLATTFDLAARAIAVANPAIWASRSARLVLALSRLTSPVIRLLASFVDLFVRPFGARARFAPPKPPLEEIQRLLMEEANRQGIDPQGPRLIRNIFEMSEKTARDVMVSRPMVVALEVGTPPEEILRVLSEQGHSRMPVFKDTIDNLVGVVHSRDIVPLMQHPELIVIHDILRPAHFLPWSKPVGEILREMQKKRIHMGFVVDEYGGFLGIVTLEDVLEVIVGDLSDEFHQDVREIESLSDGSMLVRAAIPLEAFNRALQVEVPPGEYETLGGFLNSLAGCIPEAGDKFFFGGLQFTVQDRDTRRVKRVRLHRVKKEPAKEKDGKPLPVEKEAKVEKETKAARVAPS